MLSGKTLYGATADGGEWTGGGGAGGTIFSVLLGLATTVSATPNPAHVGDTIAVVVNVVNTDSENVTSIQLAGPVAVNGAGVVSPAGSSGPTVTPVLAPVATTSFTNLFTATNDGTVTFTATATASGSDGVAMSSSATSAPVSIVARGDLLIKRAVDPPDLYAGLGVYQTVPIAPQVETNVVANTTDLSQFQVQVQNNDAAAQTFTLQAAVGGPRFGRKPSSSRTTM